MRNENSPAKVAGLFSVVRRRVVYTILLGLDDPFGAREKPAPEIIGVWLVAELERLAAAVDAVAGVVGSLLCVRQSALAASTSSASRSGAVHRQGM